MSARPTPDQSTRALLLEVFDLLTQAGLGESLCRRIEVALEGFCYCGDAYERGRCVNYEHCQHARGWAQHSENELLLKAVSDFRSDLRRARGEAVPGLRPDSTERGR